MALPSASSAAPASATQPTLSIERNCEAIPGANTVDVILSGSPPSTPFQATLEFDESGIGPIQLTTDENGSFDSSTVGLIREVRASHVHGDHHLGGRRMR